MARQFKVHLNIKRSAVNELVRFKVDGGRFESSRTLKLNVNTPYDLEFTFKPPQKIEMLNVQGSKVTPTEGKRELSHSIYTAKWMTTGFDANKKGNRVQVPIIIMMEGLGELKLMLQCKCYPESERSHVNWGDPVNYIEYECKMPEGSSFADIMKETFR